MTRYIDYMETTSAPQTNNDFQYFRVVGFEQRTYTPGAGSLMPGSPVPSGTCDYCGTGIKYAVIAEDTRNGGRCDIGTDCAQKIGLAPADIRNARRNWEYNTPEARRIRKAARAAERAASLEYEAKKLAEEASKPLLPREVGSTDALFDLQGNLVTTNMINGRYGLSWVLPNRGGYVSAFPKRLTTMSKKGYYEGTVVCERKSGSNGEYFPQDNNYEYYVIAVIDNGTEATSQFADRRTDNEKYGYHNQKDSENVFWVEPVEAPYAEFLTCIREACKNAWLGL